MSIKNESDDSDGLKPYEFGSYQKVGFPDQDDLVYPIFACINIIDMCEMGCPMT